MDSRYVERDAAEIVERGARQGVGRDLALRVYTTRLLGQDPRLVLHGGGNTSVKTVVPDLLGQDTAVLCVKGTGWDMGAMEPPGMPAVRLEPLLKLRARDAVGDEEMVRFQRASLIDPMAPNPSVETLLHAFVPHKFVDHTHATAILSLSDQPDGEAICAEVFDGRMGIVPYIMPGFALAKKSAEVFEASPQADGLILHKHGIFTFGASAHEAYERMIEMVSRAEARLAQNRKSVFVTAQLPQRCAALATAAPIVRGACSLKEPSEGAWRRLILEFRGGDAVRTFVDGAEVARYSQAGVVTPDHTIRTKNWPLVLPPAEDGKADDFKRAAAAMRLRHSSRDTEPLSPATTRAPADRRRGAIPCPASLWCPGSACSASAAPRRTPRSRPISRKPRSRRSRTRKRLDASSRSPKPICSTSNTGRSSRRSSAPPRSSPSPARSPW